MSREMAGVSAPTAVSPETAETILEHARLGNIGISGLIKEAMAGDEKNV